MKEFRADKEFAREVFEFLLPDEKLRRQCLQFLADSIQTADRLAHDRWGITLYSDGVRMNCGWIEVLTIRPAIFHVIVDASSLPEKLTGQVEIRKGKGKGLYPSVPGSAACDLILEHADMTMPQLVRSHEKIIQKASGTAFPPNRKNAHSPGVIDYLASYLGIALPQPAYVAWEHAATEPLPDVDQMFISVREGRKKLVLHLRRERNQRIVEAKKQQVLSRSERLSCEACGFDFRAFYGERGKDFCEVHHKTAFAEVVEEIETRLEDLAVLCSNCHRMIHRTPMVSLEELKEVIVSNR